MTENRVERQFLSQSREKEIAELAEGIADYEFLGVAVEPKRLAFARGITVSENDYGDAFDGLLEHRADKFHIYCNAARAHTAARVRFTIAHELGHYFIDEHREALRSGRVKEHGSFCDFRSKNPVEREADCFASNLLMPPQRFRKEASARPVSLATVAHLSDTFQTSKTSAAIRLVDLDLAVSGVVLWHDGSFAWKWLSDRTRAAGILGGLHDSATVPADSATGRVIAGEKVADGSPIITVSTAATWFRGIAPGSVRDIVLREEAISLGRFGVLTLLVERSL